MFPSAARRRDAERHGDGEQDVVVGNRHHDTRPLRVGNGEAERPLSGAGHHEPASGATPPRAEFHPPRPRKTGCPRSGGGMQGVVDDGDTRHVTDGDGEVAEQTEDMLEPGERHPELTVDHGYLGHGVNAMRSRRHPVSVTGVGDRPARLSPAGGVGAGRTSAGTTGMLAAMCGIAGVRRFDRGVDHVGGAAAAAAVMGHRGPDDANAWHDDRMALAFRRLAIVGLDNGRQPIVDDEGRYVLAGNGEIYNHLELRAGLEARGRRLRTRSDLEVVLHLYAEEGPASFSRLRGMYAFAIWDTATGELVCCRDPFGIKPLYYQSDATAFRFASELPALAEALPAMPALRPESVLRFLTFQYVPEPDTAVAGVAKLPAGHFVRVTTDGDVSLHRWWEPRFAPEDRTFDDYVEEVRAAIADSVHIHRSTEVEQGAFLSGGIDSSLTSALANRTSPTPTFSVGFAHGIDELANARRAADALGTEHHELRITDQMAFDGIDLMVAHLGEPLADPAALGLFYVSQLAATKVTTVLSGEGADELFLGYRLYDEPRALAPFARVPGPLRRLAAGVARRSPDVRGRDWVLRASTPLERRYIGNGRVGSAGDRASVLTAPWATPDALAEPYAISDRVYAEADRLGGMDDVRRMQYLDLHLWLPGDILTKADRLSMAHSLELRVPFLDRVVWDAASRIPVDLQLDAHTTKRVLRAAASDVLPPEVYNLPKLGFPVPVRTWLSGPWGEGLRDELAGYDLGGVVDTRAVVGLLDRHRSGAADHSRLLWALMILGRWNDQFSRRCLSRVPPRASHLASPGTVAPSAAGPSDTAPSAGTAD